MAPTESNSADVHEHDQGATGCDGLQLDLRCLEHTLVVSFGKRATDNLPSAVTLTFGELVERFSKPDITRGSLNAAEYHALDKADSVQKTKRSSEKDGPYFVACRFVGDGRRCNDNVELLCGMPLDFDSGRTTEADIRRLLAGHTYLAYTSYSHRPELEKWRVFLPYRGPISRNEHASAFQHFKKLFLGDIAPRCETASQLWYTPACPKDAAHEFRAFHAIGSLFDPKTLSAQSDASDAETPPGAQDTEAGVQSNTVDDSKTPCCSSRPTIENSGLISGLQLSRTSEKQACQSGSNGRTGRRSLIYPKPWKRGPQ